MPAAQFAVFGHPIGHSLSPLIHQAFARQFGIDLEYRAIDAAPADFAAAVHRFFAGGGRGANVTLPHKAAAFALADQRSVAATRAGSANVLTPLAAGRLAAHNTDGAGLVRDITERHDLDLRGHTALLLGAGGAAHGVAWNLLDAGVETLTIANRSPVAADVLADAIGDPLRAHTRYWEDLADIGSYDLIVNATSAGVLGMALQLPFSLVGARALCYDLSYGAAAGSFLAWAQAAGARYAVDGLGMLVETAADAFELWHGRRPDTEPVFQSLRQRAA
ncbi:shikimate dehydrogenase [Rhodanobacter sp. FW510-R12]|uniref:shikimate dehydrogenase n=1 Tax=unclassified Rhodanobacter TaxID=2621553 RepID=UPI0007AA4631|nr:MULTISPECIES: shikimate dehydrogenase [unclassified Rhodanobacter]KZC16727.1 shikimate dehydrogenase [Rhodanobacter sp. FW104-R8]KZC27412.1 shikimate dehydrogenase [Rhodanobacter sp. FW510-T8]KZC31947.1 shikimate dehydrogenase [Rhodanobacter sp. FW510-R10]